MMASAERSGEARLLSGAFLQQIEDLETQAAQQQAAIAELTGVKTALQNRLAAHQRELASVAEQGNRSRKLVSEMRQAIADAEALLGAVAEERLALHRQLEAAQAQLGEASGQRDASRLVEVGLRLARVPHDEGGAEGEAGHALAEALDHAPLPVPPVAASHAFEHRVGGVLKRHVDVGDHPRVVRQELDERVVETDDRVGFAFVDNGHPGC